MRKKRLLFSTEFSGLNTGYACIARNLIGEIYKTGKYEIAEHSRYCKGSDPYHQSLMRQIPWKIYPNLPEGDQEEQIYRSHPANEFGRWKHDVVCLDFQPDVVCSWDDMWMSIHIDQSPLRRFYKTVTMPTVDACFVKNTIVITPYGSKNIQDIEVGDKVICHDGSVNKVNRLYKRNYKGKLITINTNGPTRPITMTENHPVLVIKYKGQKWTHTSRLHRSVNHKFSDAEFIPANQIKEGDYLVVPNTNTFENIDSFNIEDYLTIDYKEYSHGLCTSKNYTLSHNIPNKITLNEEFAGMLGLYVAEGSVDKPERALQISMCKSKEQEYLDFAQKVILDTFNIPTKRYPRQYDCEILSFNSKILGNFLKNSCGDYAENKKIPDFIFKASPKIAIAFLEKLFIGDGSDTNGPHNNRVISYSTASRELAYQVSRLLLQLGVLSNLGKQENGKGRNYTVVVQNYHGQKLADLFDWQNESFKFSEYDNTKSWIDKESGHAIVRVSDVKIEEIDDYITVYNLGVENKESYCTGFAVHNCSQNLEWIDNYIRQDHVLTYTKFAEKVLANEGGGLIPLRGVATPAVDINTYKFSGNRAQHKQKFGLDPNSIIIGMVARNQRRKLYPDFGEAFASFLERVNFKGTENLYLYWHTSHPDLGWDIPKYITNLGLSHKVLMTYFCQRCRNWFPSFYQDATTVCRFCGTKSATLSNSQMGIDTAALSAVYNFMDLYVQFITNEGLGIPMVEAAACGCPITGTYYSGTEDLIDNLQGHPIKPRTLFHEAETFRVLSYPSIEELTDYIEYFTRLPASVRHNMSVKTEQLTRKFYGGWSSVAQTWMRVFDSIEISGANPWASPPDFVNTNNLQPIPPDRANDEQYIGWLLGEVLHRPDWINSYIGLKMLRDLGYGRTVINNLGFCVSEMSQLGGRVEAGPCNRETSLNMVKQQREQYNMVEQMRINMIQTGKIK